MIFILFALVIAVIAVIFALSNIGMVTVTFFIWSFQGSLALVLLGALAVGLLVGLLAALPGLVRGRVTIGGHKKKISATEKDRDQYKQRAETAEKEVKELEEQTASLSAALEQYQNGVQTAKK
ncbi:MAG: lipopolysaccharide assembly protein LapA domain-containing protein [Anaerolineaceae bacterium]|nr:lipopolysaccharide assembly protein LapA domain-containing protein [Anaerolineaceae bacterium]